MLAGQLNSLACHSQRRKSSLVDNIFNVAEKYASTSEEMGLQRRQEDGVRETEEQRRTFTYSELSRSLTEEIQRGRLVAAGSYHDVSILFCRVVGFNYPSLERKSDSLCTLVSDIHHMFMHIADRYDVFEVDTIGDSYMFVSGFPTGNDKQHCVEIASMAINLLDSYTQLKQMRSFAEDSYLKIGIHTGPCIAGIIGRKIQRLCLFGNTVSTALKLEATSLPDRVHISSKFKDELDNFGVFKFESAGNILDKAHGIIQTFSLTGKL